MSRSTVRSVDTLLVVTEPYFRSLESAGRLFRLARELPIPRIVALANKVRSPAEERAVTDYLAAQQVACIGVIPYDDAVRDADAQGRPVLDVAPDCPAVRAL
ncbi:MAG: cobyrinic acid ac-diamide synthase, partial [Planctomycetota bacterium]